MTGYISRIVKDGGFAFLRVPDQSPSDIFVHASDLADGCRLADLQSQQAVDVEEIFLTAHGLRARGVRPRAFPPDSRP